eukprot:CAMPEP_0118892496 /NCGR_PEP_ID=MMETSP1166-20130328/2074_1 /TAXON_ID=1104430 /ORGANISM="Chrysoreinhardia sp, Strain CCMP3193" /LENGTH=157 /DNA_ID=CAMNT_0006831227 /DNA_START=126 /DNA_END=596 /DNA_ORIENTATION=-
MPTRPSRGGQGCPLGPREEDKDALLAEEELSREAGDGEPDDGRDVDAEGRGDHPPRGSQERFRRPCDEVVGDFVGVDFGVPREEDASEHHKLGEEEGGVKDSGDGGDPGLRGREDHRIHEGTPGDAEPPRTLRGHEGHHGRRRRDEQPDRRRPAQQK